MTVINFNDLSSGTVVDNEYSAQGVTVSAIGGAGDAMIFDTAHPTGGDNDLQTGNLGKVLIISEDGDSSDPDDNAGGGILRFVFDEPASVESLTFLDIEEGAYVRFYDESGSLIKTERIDPTSDNGQSVESFDVDGVYRMEVELKGSGAIDNLVFESAAADLDGTVEGTAGDDLIDVNYTGDPDGDMIDANDQILAGEGINDDLVYGFAGDDTILAGDGDDEVYGGSGDDSVDGGAGDDIIYGDRNGQPEEATVVRESFNWEGRSDSEIDGGFSVNTGNVTVTYDRTQDTGSHESSLGDDDLNTAGIDAGGETVDDDSSLQSITNGKGNTGEFSWDFSEPVENVSFNVNDIDGDGVVTIRAYDLNGNLIPVVLTGGDRLTLLDTDSVAGADTADSRGGYDDVNTTDYTLNVSIAGPVSRIELEHTQDGSNNSGINVTDIYFDTTDGNVGSDVDGNDVLAGGLGEDLIYGEGGNDDITGGVDNDTLYGGTGDDTVQGGAGDDSIEGGAGNDLLIGDGDDGAVVGRVDELTLQWTEAAATGTGLGATQTYGVGGMNVTVEFDQQDQGATGEISSTDMYVESGENFDANSGLYLYGLGGEGGIDNTSTTTLTFASDDAAYGDEVQDVSFRINDIDNGSDADDHIDIVTVRAYDADGNEVPVTITAESAAQIINGNTVTGGVEHTAGITPASQLGSVLYNIAGPVARIEIDYDNGEDTDQRVDVTDINFFTTPAETVDAEAGDDVISGGDGVDEIYGNAGNDTLSGDAGDDVVYGGADRDVIIGGAGDTVDGGAAGDDYDILDVTGQGEFILTGPGGVGDPIPDSNGNGFDGRLVFLDSNGDPTDQYIDFVEIEEIRGEQANAGPIATDDSFTGTEDDPAQVVGNVITGDTGNGVDSDPDGDPLTVAAVNGNPAGVGTPVAGDNGGLVTIGEDGIVSFDPNGDFEALGDGESDTTTVTYTVTDPDGLESTATVTFTVTGSNDGPVAVADLGTTDEGTAVGLDNVLGNDIDPDDTDLTVSAVNGAVANVGAPTDGDGGGSFTIGEDGTASFDPAGDFDYLAPGETAESAITYTVADPDGETSTTTVTVTVTGVNDGPVAVDNSYLATSTEAAGDIDGNVITDNTGAGVDSDPEGDTLTVSAVAGDAGNVGAAVAGDNGGLFTINADGTVDFDANGDFGDLGLGATADTSVTYTIIDENGAEDTATATFTVSGINDGTVQGTAGDDIINPDIPYVDADGDIVDANDAILPGDVGNDDLILGFGGNDSIDAGEGDDVVFGGTGNDTIEGGAGNDQLMGNDGDDVITGGDGDDMIFGAEGDDSLAGNAGNDKIEGSEGDDTIRGGDGEDDLWGGLDDDTVFGGDDNDTVAGGAGNDTLDGGTGDDLVLGEDGDDSIQGGTGDDSIDGGAGNDNINAGQGNDVVAGGDGNDVINAGNTIDPALDYDYPSIPSGDNDPFPNNDLDTVFGGAGDDVITTGDDNDSIDGGAGNDYIDAGIDDDSVTGGTGNDTIIGGQGEDIIEGNDGDDLIYGGLVTEVLDLPDAFDEAPDDNRDTIYGGAGNDTIFGRDDADTLYGGTGNDVLDGGIDDDVIFGDDGDDTIYGGQGNDVINGGTGVDLIYGGLGDDTIQGNQDDDAIYGDEGNDTITGSLDDDLVFGGADDDEIRGGTGDDTLHGDAGNDYIQGGYGDDSLYGGDGDDSLNGGFGNDIVEGGDGNDTIAGFDGEDVLTGGAGEDTLYGGQNSDLFLGGNGGDNVVGGEDPDDSDVDVLDLTGSNVDFITYTDGDPESGVVTFLDGTTMTFSEIENVIPCFTPGTTIATAKGERLVEELKVGDRIITRDNGIQEIAWVGHKEMTGKQLVQNPHLKPILIKAGALGNGLPERDMMVSPNHRVLVASELTQLYFEENEVLAAAKHMVGTQGIHAIDVMSTTYVHFMFERHEVVLSNGAWTESFQPGDYSLKGIGNSQRNEIMELFPDLATKSGLEGYQSARKALKKHEAKLLIK